MPGPMTAVLMPTTRASATASAPPEFPGSRAASVWMTLSTNRFDDPDAVTSDLPNALTTPALTEPRTRRGCRSPPPAAPRVVRRHPRGWRPGSRCRPPARRRGPRAIPADHLEVDLLTRGERRHAPLPTGDDMRRVSKNPSADDHGRSRARGSAPSVTVDAQPHHRGHQTLRHRGDRPRVRIERTPTIAPARVVTTAGAVVAMPAVVIFGACLGTGGRSMTADIRPSLVRRPPPRQVDGQRHLVGTAHHEDLDRRLGIGGLERPGQLVDRRDVCPRHADDEIAGPKPGPIGRSALLHGVDE